MRLVYKNYLLILLMAIMAFNYVDRWALGVVLEDIKTDLRLTDTQLGFLSGIAFALFYSVMGVPIARWADRGNRVTIISLTTAVWSVAVALCGAVTNFMQLLGVRVAVAIGEAGCVPPAHSLIADTFTRSERPRAVSLYLLGVPLSLVIGYFAAGWLNELFGWRATFAMLGLCGLVPAAVAYFTLRESRLEKRRIELAQPIEVQQTLAERQHGLSEVIQTLWANSAFRHLLFCFAVWYFSAYGLQQWLPTFFIRSYGLGTGEVGTWLAAIYGLGGCLGIYLGGELAARYAANNERVQLLACATAFVVSTALELCVYLAPSYHLSFGVMAVDAFVAAMAQGPIVATMQTLVPPRMRATSIALVYFVANLIGMGLGPLATGVVSDALRTRFGDESLRYALVMLCPGYLWAAWHLWRASGTVGRDLQYAARAQSDAPEFVPNEMAAANDTRSMRS